MRLVSYQPHYFPRLHYFARILDADIFAVADYVQFVRKHAYHLADGTAPIGPSYQAHTPIKTEGGPLLIDIPTKHDGRQSILETRLAFAKPKDRLRNFRLVQVHYRMAPRFLELMPILEALYKRPHGTVAEINLDSILTMLGVVLEIEEAKSGALCREAVESALASSDFRLRRIVPFSTTSLSPSDKDAGRDANDWLVDACKAFGADEYYFGGTGAGAYMDFGKYEAAGIRLIQQDWKVAPYPQLHGEFVPNLSIIDLLMNVGPAEARAILLTKNQ